MKHAIRAFWRSALRWLNAGHSFILFALCCAGIAAWGSGAWAAPAPITHFTQAEIWHDNATGVRPLTAKLDETALPAAWVPVQLPYALERNRLPAGSAKPGTMTTFWFRISLDGLKGQNGPIDFYLPRWLAAGKLAVYADGQLIYRSPGSPVWNLFTHPALLLPLSRGVDGAMPKTLLLRLDLLSGQNAALSSFYVGDATLLTRMATDRDWLAYQLPFMCSAAFLAVGLFALVVWLTRRRELAYLLLFFIAVLSLVRRWHFHVSLAQLSISDAWFIWWTLNALLWQVVAEHYFMVLFHRRSQPWLNHTLLILGVIFSLATLPVVSLFPSMLWFRPYAHLILIGIATVVVFVNLWSAFRSSSREAQWLSGAVLLTFIAGMVDWARIKFLMDLEGYYWTPYAAIALFAVFMVITFRRYVGALDEVEQVNANLETRLKDRETELAQSYAQLRRIEQRQILGQERERITQDMHDGLGLSLVSALREAEDGKLAEAEMAQVLRGCIDDLKLAIDAMEPVDADLLLLLATLRFRLGPRLAKAGVALRWEIENVPPLNWLDPRNSLHILRILQETFTNILKHTKASEIRVSTGTQGDHVTVTIADNGRGFIVAHGMQSGGHGLVNQLRRAQAIGAQIRLESASTGTQMTLCLPQRQAG